LARTPLRPDDPTRIGHYRLTARLGSGGMGVVYLGVTWDGNPVAVKVLRPDLAGDQEFRLRFGREVAALVRVKGECTVRVIEADSQSSTPFVVTEYAQGPSLSEYIDKHGSVGPDLLHGLATGLAEALTVIHAAGIMHRDLKPSNIILTDAGPKVIDFGIARRQDTTGLTQTGMMIGSMGFMAPEQISGRPGPEADVFAWGVTVAYAASGRSPFGAGNTHSILYRIMYGDPDIAAVPDPLRPLVQAALTKDPRSRPTAAQLLDHLTSTSRRTNRINDTPTKVILSRTWPTGLHSSPSPTARPGEASRVSPRAPSLPHPASSPSPSPPPPLRPSPLHSSPLPPSPLPPSPLPPSPLAPEPPGAEVRTAASPAPQVAAPQAPGPATASTERIPVGRRVATLATSALVALRLRRPGARAPDHSQPKLGPPRRLRSQRLPAPSAAGSAQPGPQVPGGYRDREDSDDAADQDIRQPGLYPGSEVAAGDAADAQRDAGGPVRRDPGLADGQDGEREHPSEGGHEGRGQGGRGDLRGRVAGPDQDGGQDRAAAYSVHAADTAGQGRQEDQHGGREMAAGPAGARPRAGRLAASQIPSGSRRAGPSGRRRAAREPVRPG
jgi:serine/threonine protein kinase